MVRTWNELWGRPVEEAIQSRYYNKQFRTVIVEFGAAAIKERAACGLCQFDAQPLGGDSHINVALEFFEVGHLPHCYLQLFLQLRHIVAREDEVLTPHPACWSQLSWNSHWDL